MKKQIESQTKVSVADEAWLATALLHREQPGRQDFEIREIVERAAAEGLHTPLRPGVYVHVVQHDVANRPPNPGRYRLLYETRRGFRRLFRPGDDWHPARKDGRTMPVADAIPVSHRDLLAWYKQFVGAEGGDLDPILSLRGLGKELWTEEDADNYVAELRRGWE